MRRIPRKTGEFRKKYYTEFEKRHLYNYTIQNKAKGVGMGMGMNMYTDL
jgi:hypothetical protein